MSTFDDGLEILDDEECLQLLRKGIIGRVAISVGALPAVFPVNYGVDGDDVVFFTNDGAKLRAALNGTVVAFEVDYVDEETRSGWSVLVVGRANECSDPAVLERARGLGIVAWAPGTRDRLVRIHPEMVTGRRIAACAV